MTGLINVALKAANSGIKDIAVGDIRSVSDLHSNPKVKMVKIGVIVALAVICMAMQQVSGQCQVCQDGNGAYCETENKYFICLGQKKLGPFDCEVDEVCTNSDKVCEKKSDLTTDIRNVCGQDNGFCQSCSTGDKFTCVSKTQAARCVGGAMSTSIIIDCDEDETCVSEAQGYFTTVCVPNCVVSFANMNATCSNDVYTPPTLAPPTTPNPMEMQTICAQAAVGKTSRFFYAYADWTCRSYVYCERNSASNTFFETTFTGSCSSPNPYFNTVSGRCQATVPESCRTDAPTTERSTPTTVANTPTTVTNAPTTVSNMPTTVTNAPTTETNTPTPEQTTDPDAPTDTME